MKIIDNFLSEKYFKTIQDYMMGDQCAWTWWDGINDPGDGKWQLCNSMFDADAVGIQDSFFEVVEPMLHQMDDHVPIQELLRIKSNLNPKTIEHEHGGFHIDYNDVTTAIFYINTNNGWTNFKNGDKVESVENRLVIFDSNLEHEGVTCTDEDRRVVINFNYVPAL